MKDPLISIVILNYNGLHYLRKTIPFIIGLEYENYEVLVVDNDSKDGSKEWLSGFSKIKIIKNPENLGYSKGKNLGVQKASGEYVLLLDEDTQVRGRKILGDLFMEYQKLDSPGFLSLLLSQGDKKITTFYAGFIHPVSFYHNKGVELSKILGRDTFQCASPDGQAIFFKRNIFLDLGGYDDSQPYYIDVGDLGLRASVAGYKNYVYCKEYFTHMGEIRKTELKSWCWKYSYYFSGLARVMWKNYLTRNLVIYFPLFCSFSLAKTVLQLFKKRSFCVVNSFFSSALYFIKKFPSTLRERKRIQRTRKDKNDSFLLIKAPNFYE